MAMGLGRMFGWLRDIFSCWVQIIGPLFVMLATGLISFVIYTFFAHILPIMAPDMGLKRLALLTWAFVLIVNITFNYFRVVTVSPGYPPEDAV